MGAKLLRFAPISFFPLAGCSGGQHPLTLFIGCSDSRLVPYLLTGTGPGELFLVRNVGAFVPPWDGSAGYHGTAAAIEFAVLNLKVTRIVVCGHSHCGGIRALYEGAPAQAPKVAVAVLVENGGDRLSATGGAVAAPIGRAVIAAALQEGS